MSSTQHQLIEQCATRLRGIVEALDNIHDTSPQRWSTDLDDVHSSAESLLALIKDQAPARSEASFEEWLANELEGEDGQPVPAAVCDIALARRAFNHWPKLEQPAKVGGVRFSAGVSSRLVVEAAQRLYEFESTPEKEAERIERLQAFREQCFEPLGTEFSKVLSDNLPELLSTAQAEHAEAEAERPEVVGSAWRNIYNNGFDHVAPFPPAPGGPVVDEPLMTVAQHERIAASRWERAMDLMGEHVARISEKLTKERDAALAEVERLRQFERICEGLPQDAIDGGWTVQGIRAHSKQLEEQHKAAQAEVEALRAELQSQRERNTELIFKLGSATNGWGRCEKERDAAQARCAELKAELAMANDAAAKGDAARHQCAGMEMEIKELRGTAEHWEAESKALQKLLDAALAKLAELEKQEPVAAVSEETFSANGTSDIITRNLPIGTTLYAAPVAQAQHSVPEGWMLVPVEQLLNMMSDKDHDTRIMAERQLLAVLAAAPGTEVPQAWLDVQAERRRQITAEGWTPDHDDAHSHGEMARAAACYALAGSSAPNDGTAALLVSLAWPWDEQWWKPSTARRDMVKACALGLAEIERLDRAAATQGGPRDA
ncbi:hypothetical protein [Pseudomonas aeruginosa]|uniref:hypothetical protein n=1 Tax=Pseudomonas aeruginosa TaxID=287 RepID=UPI001D0B230D|nr:hypothetical protein [Pseudomonas aeruginosa]MCC0186014.1 hypothetical protein [Pseudomonas aeruginosa]